MNDVIRCPNPTCQAKLRIATAAMSKRVRCPKCQAAFQPRGSPPAVVAESAPSEAYVLRAQDSRGVLTSASTQAVPASVKSSGASEPNNPRRRYIVIGMIAVVVTLTVLVGLKWYAGIRGHELLTGTVADVHAFADSPVELGSGNPGSEDQSTSLKPSSSGGVKAPRQLDSVNNEPPKSRVSGAEDSALLLDGAKPEAVAIQDSDTPATLDESPQQASPSRERPFTIVGIKYEPRRPLVHEGCLSVELYLDESMRNDFRDLGSTFFNCQQLQIKFSGHYYEYRGMGFTDRDDYSGPLLVQFAPWDNGRYIGLNLITEEDARALIRGAKVGYKGKWYP